MSAASWVSEAPLRVRERVNRNIRHAIGLTQAPPEACRDPSEAYAPVNGIARIIHGDLSSMLIGGIASLFLQMLHPPTMAGVAQHSRYQHDPLGRVLQTANFIGATTYGSRAAAYGAIERVLSVHEVVRGVDDEQRPYYANDPHLLEWVHDAGTSMFLAGYQEYGALSLSNAHADQYVLEMATVAHDLGAENPPTNVAELDASLERFRPELRLSADGVIARDFVRRGVVRGLVQPTAYRLLVHGALDLLTPWARELLGVSTHPLVHRVAIRPATSMLCAGLRAAVPPYQSARWQS